MERLKTAYQYIIPQHGLTRLAGKLASSKNKMIKTVFINFFLKNFDIKMAEALIEDPTKFATFNEFFTRELKPGIRPMPDDDLAIASPVDGKISQLGEIISNANGDDDIFQAKGHSFTLAELLGNEPDLVKPYKAGKFSTIYLAPKDYHRIHMPLDAELKAMTYIPGRLFSVNPATARTIPRLFARNERVVAHFETAVGPMAMVLVGATIVGSIATVFSGIVTPPTGNAVRTWHYDKGQYCFKRGEEMGRFLLGSTVVLLFGKDKISWDKACVADKNLKLGESIGLPAVSA